MRYAKPAPVVLFVYNRPEHTRKTVESLAKNLPARHSRLYLFSDGPKSTEDRQSVESVRAYIRRLRETDLFADVQIEYSPVNKGLAESIISGVTKVIRRHGRCIVMEDDLLCAPDFLDFMNAALDFYETDQRIGSISGYSPLAELPSDYRHDVWMACRSSSLGWGTWRDRWEEVDWEVGDFSRFQKNRKAIRRFNACGSDQYDRLRRQVEEGADSWAVRFSYWQSRSHRYTLFPARTRIQHIGWDGTGIHGTYSGPLDTHIAEKAVPFTLEKVDPDPSLAAMMRRLYSGPFSSRFARYLRVNGFRRLEKTLRKILGKEKR